MASFKIRTRTKGDVQTKLFYLRHNVKSIYYGWVYTNWYLPQSLTYGMGNVIIDEVTPYANGKPTMSLEQSKRIFKNVSNTTIDHSIEDVDTVDTCHGVSYPYTDTATINEYFWHRGWMISYIDSYNLFPTVSSLQLFEVVDVAKAFKALQPSFKDAKVNGINIYTIILELADLRKTFSRAALQMGKTLTATVAEKNLLINFGILPFFSDIQAIYDIITKLSDYIDMWNSAASRGMIFDSHKELPPVDVDTSFSKQTPAIVYHDWAYNVSSKNYGIKAKAKVHLYFKPRTISADKRINVYKRALGLDQPLAGIWEAVPFSWAVDYFLNVGEMIDHFDEQIETMFQFDYVSGGYSIESTIGGTIQYDAVRRPLPPREIMSLSTPPSFSRQFSKREYIRGRLSLESMMAYMTISPELHAQISAGPKQFSYLASVAYLRSLK